MRSPMRAPATRASLWRRLVPDPFLILLVATVAVGLLLPARGEALDSVGMVATAAIVLLFFLHGVRLPREAVVAALGHWRLHITILAISFVAFPLIGLAMARAGHDLMQPGLWLGFLFLCALPSTVQSSIAFTSIAGGNVAAAVCAAAASNLVGILLTPVIVAALTGAQGGHIDLSGIGGIVVELLLPFVAGHLARPWLGQWAAQRQRLLGMTDRGTIVLAVYVAVAEAVGADAFKQLGMMELGVLVVLLAVLLAIVLAGSWVGARRLGFTREDAIVILFCGSKKGLVTGIPMARVLFGGPQLGLVILSVMLFHQMQLMVCAAIARRLSEPKE